MCLATVSLVLLVSRGLLAAPLFSASAVYRLGPNPDLSHPYSVCVIDFDMDGHPDLAVADEGYNKVWLLRNRGKGTFDEEIGYDVGSGPTSVASADFDGDGVPDLVVANRLGTTISILKNNGNGTFAPSISYDAGYSPATVVTADFDGDGKIDLAATDYLADSVSVLRNNGDGTFAAAASYGVGSYPWSLCAADFNGDGRPDLAVANQGSNSLSIMFNNGNGTFAAPVNYTVGTSPLFVCAADFDGDGHVDLAVANADDNTISILRNDGGGGFAAPVVYPAGERPVSICAADFNGDGALDLAVTNLDSSQGLDVSIFLNDGTGIFSAAGFYASGDAPIFVCPIDCNSDGRPDLAVACQHYSISVMINTYHRRPLRYVSKNGPEVFPYDLPTLAAKSIQTAVDAALSGDTVLVAAGTYANPVSADSAVYILGGWDTTFATRDISTYQTTIQCAGSCVSFLNIASGICGLEGFTLSFGTGTTAQIPILGGYGGGVFSYNSSPIIRHTRIIDCGYVDAVNFSAGGGIACYGGSPLIEDNELAGCAAQSGGGIYLYQTNATVKRNHISGSAPNPDYAGSKLGGGIYAYQASAMLEGNRIEKNNGYGKGGGICLRLSPTTLQGDTILANACVSDGGGIEAERSPLSVSSSVLFDNRSSTGRGGGIYFRAGNLDIEGTVIARDTAATFGGGLYADSSLGSIRGNTIDRNVSAEDGGGVFLRTSVALTFGYNIVTNDSTDGVATAGLQNLVFQFNDCYGNSPANCSGVEPDSTNISVDPIFCNAASGDYRIHHLSPCLPGNHPGGVDYGLIGALGEGCNYEATLLQEFHTELRGSAVVVTWLLSEASPDIQFHVLRAQLPNAEYVDIPDAPVTRNGLRFTYVDGLCETGAAYRYRVDVSDRSSSYTLFETGIVSWASPGVTLYQNHPNPFNPATEIAYRLPTRCLVSLEIYDVGGRRIARLVQEMQEPGYHSVHWRPTDDRGSSVASGVYVYRLTAGKQRFSKKMILLR
jgi:hypothetical protein